MRGWAPALLTFRSPFNPLRPSQRWKSARVTKSVLLDTGFPGSASGRKCPSGAGLLAVNRRETPLLGGGSWENGTRFRFLREEKPAGIGFDAGGWGWFRGRNRGGKAMTR